jgi:hypothetical protein
VRQSRPGRVQEIGPAAFLLGCECRQSRLLLAFIFLRAKIILLFNLYGMLYISDKLPKRNAISMAGRATRVGFGRR